MSHQRPRHGKCLIRERAKGWCCPVRLIPVILHCHLRRTLPSTCPKLFHSIGRINGASPTSTVSASDSQSSRASGCDCSRAGTAWRLGSTSAITAEWQLHCGQPLILLRAVLSFTSTGGAMYLGLAFGNNHLHLSHEASTCKAFDEQTPKTCTCMFALPVPS